MKCWMMEQSKSQVPLQTFPLSSFVTLSGLEYATGSKIQYIYLQLLSHLTEVYMGLKKCEQDYCKDASTRLKYWLC